MCYDVFMRFRLRAQLLIAFSLCMSLWSTSARAYTVGTAALIGGGIGLAAGGLIDAGLVILSARSASGCDDSCSLTAGLIATPVAMGAIGAAIGAAFGRPAVERMAGASITPLVDFQTPDQPSFGLSITKPF